MPGQVTFSLGQVKKEVWWTSGQFKLASVVLWFKGEDKAINLHYMINLTCLVQSCR